MGRKVIIIALHAKVHNNLAIGTNPAISPEHSMGINITRSQCQRCLRLQSLRPDAQIISLPKCRWRWHIRLWVACHCCLEKFSRRRMLDELAPRYLTEVGISCERRQFPHRFRSQSGSKKLLSILLDLDVVYMDDQGRGLEMLYFIDGPLINAYFPLPGYFCKNEWWALASQYQRYSTLEM